MTMPGSEGHRPSRGTEGAEAPGPETPGDRSAITGEAPPGRSGTEPVEQSGDGPEEADLSSSELDREHAERLRRAVSSRSDRRIRARERPDESIWAFLGTFGIVGWTVAVPALAGLAFGAFLDRTTDSERSFTITFLVLGVSVGCLSAWYWVRRESSRDR